MKLPTFCFLAILLFVSCCFAGVVKVNDRIIDGDKSRFFALGYIVSITENGTHFCSGFIYNNKSVITAASCVDKKTVSSLRVVINQFNLSVEDTLEEKIPVFKVTIREDFNSTSLFNDIAILELSKELVFIPSASGTSSLPGPSCLKYEEVITNQQLAPASFYGWGATEPAGSVAEVLRGGKVTILSNNICAGQYGAEYNGTIMICGANEASGATGLMTGPCTFDEGGPIVVVDRVAAEYVALGIYSKNKDCNVDIPSVYTRLSAYYAWIYQVAGPEPGFNCLTGP